MQNKIGKKIIILINFALIKSDYFITVGIDSQTFIFRGCGEAKENL
jgi:hypothetical protein